MKIIICEKQYVYNSYYLKNNNNIMKNYSVALLFFCPIRESLIFP